MLVCSEQLLQNSVTDHPFWRRWHGACSLCSGFTSLGRGSWVLVWVCVSFVQGQRAVSARPPRTQPGLGSTSCLVHTGAVW